MELTRSLCELTHFFAILLQNCLRTMIINKNCKKQKNLRKLTRDFALVQTGAYAELTRANAFGSPLACRVSHPLVCLRLGLRHICTNGARHYDMDECYSQGSNKKNNKVRWSLRGNLPALGIAYAASSPYFSSKQLTPTLTQTLTRSLRGKFPPLRLDFPYAAEIPAIEIHKRFSSTNGTVGWGVLT